MYSCTLSLTSALDGVGRQCLAPASLPLGKSPGTHCAEGWVRPRAGMSEYGKFTATGVQTPNRSSFSEIIPTELCDQLVTKIMETV